MRLLHTADLHFGRQLHGRSLIDAQSKIAEQIVEIAKTEKVDAILLAGDIYDRAIPPVEAIELADKTFAKLVKVAPVIAISGNHDSAQRLGFAREVMTSSGLHLYTRVEQITQPTVLRDVVIYGVPYLEPDLTRHQLKADERSHQAVHQAAANLIKEHHQSTHPDKALIVVAHAFVAGGQTSESERDIDVGGASAISAKTYEFADYLALGHLHKPHNPADNSRYSGSPLPYSFSEATPDKTVTIIDIAAPEAKQTVDKQIKIKTVTLAKPYVLTRLSGKLDDLLNSLTFAANEEDWIEVTVTDNVRPHQPKLKLDKRFANILVCKLEPEDAGDTVEADLSKRITARSDLQIASAFVADLRGTDATSSELKTLEKAFKTVEAAEK